MEKRTIVLLGKSGVGKSATGNTILRMNTFESRQSFDSVTNQSEVGQAVLNGKRIHVVDTPGFFETTMSEEELARELARSIYLAPEGVHAFILVFPYGRFTEQEEEIIIKIQKVFGENVTNHMILLFTHGDGVVNNEIESSTNHHLRTVLEKCGRRYQIFDNTGQNHREQVPNFLDMIERMLELNNGMAYTNNVYEAARRHPWEQYWEMLKRMFMAVAVFIGNPMSRAEVLLEGASRQAQGLMSYCMLRFSEENQHLL